MRRVSLDTARDQRRDELAGAMLGFVLIAGWVAMLLWAVVAGGGP